MGVEITFFFQMDGNNLLITRTTNVKACTSVAVLLIKLFYTFIPISEGKNLIFWTIFILL